MMNHERELRPLIDRYAVRADVDAYFFKVYGYTERAVFVILDDMGVHFPNQLSADQPVYKK